MPLVITKSMSKFLKANEEVKHLIMSPLAKRTRLSKRSGKPCKARKQKKVEQNATLSILAKPTDGCINGKNRSRFPDPCQDRSILLAVVDSEQNFLRLNYLTSDGELHPDEGSEKDTGNVNYSCQYFVLLEKIERKYTTDNRTEVYTYPSNGYLDNFMYANLQDHTIVDKCLPDGVAGYWIRTFGEPSVFILTIALWKWTGTSRKSKKNLNTCSDCLRRLNDVKVEFSNVPRTERKPKNTTSVEENKVYLDATDLLKESANNGIIKTLRTFRDNGMVKEFDFACKSFLRTSDEHKNKDSCVIVMLEQSLFYSQQGNPAQAKKVLQSAVEISGKAKYSSFLLNRAYLYLATVHVNDGTTGTAEECLSMVKKDSNLGLPHEDVGWYFILKGIIYTKFGEKIDGFAEKLWVEAKNMFLSALTELNQAECCQVLSVEAHLCLAKLYLVISNARKNTQPSNGSIAFQNVDELIAMAAEHLNFVQTLEQCDFSERLQLKYNIVQAECYLSSYLRERQVTSTEEGYWSADPVDKGKLNPFSDSNQEEEELREVSQTALSEVPPAFDNNLQYVNIPQEGDNIDSDSLSHGNDKSNLEHFGLIISSRKCSPVEVHDDEIASSAEDTKYLASEEKRDVEWTPVDKEEASYDKKEGHNYLGSAKECLLKIENLFQNPLFSLEKKDYDRVSALLEKMEISDRDGFKLGKHRLGSLSGSINDSGYEADCSSLDGVQLGSVYEQTTYV